MNGSQPNPRTILIVSTFVLLLVVLGIIYYLTKDKMRDLIFRTSYSSARSAHATGNTDAAIEEFEKLLDSAPDRVMAAKVRQYLVDNLFSRNEGNDRARAIKLTEETINDFRIPPRARAMALNILAANIMGKDEAFFRLNFTSDTLNTYLPPNGTAVNSYNIAIRMFKDADEIYPTVYARYRLTDAYFRLLIRGNVSDDAETADDMARAIQNYVKAGDEIIDSDTDYNAGTRAKLYYLKTVNTVYSGALLNNISTGEIKSIYKDTIDRISALPSSEDPRVSSYLQMTNSHYADVSLGGVEGLEESILFRFAREMYTAGEISRGFALMKKIIAEPQYSKLVKAHAIQGMLQEYYAKGDDEIFDELFKGTPYASFRANKSESEALREMVAYGTSFYPLPLLELRMADYYADDLLSLSNRAENSRATTLQTDIARKIASADRGIIELSSSDSLLPVIHNRKAVVLGKLRLAGIQTFQEPDSVYELALEQARLQDNPGAFGFITINYAAYIAEQDGAEASARIKTLLNRIYNDTVFNSKRLFIVIDTARKLGPTNVDHKKITLLASFDPDFKEFLSARGWY